MSFGKGVRLYRDVCALWGITCLSVVWHAWIYACACVHSGLCLPSCRSSSLGYCIGTKASETTDGAKWSLGPGFSYLHIIPRGHPPVSLPPCSRMLCRSSNSLQPARWESGLLEECLGACGIHSTFQGAQGTFLAKGQPLEVSGHRGSGNAAPGCSVPSKVVAPWILSGFSRCGSQVIQPAIR